MVKKLIPLKSAKSMQSKFLTKFNNFLIRFLITLLAARLMVFLILKLI